MKYFILILSLFTCDLFAAELPELAKNTTTKKESKQERVDREAQDNISKLFLDTLDPASVLKEMMPEFIEYKDIQTSPDDVEQMGSVYAPKSMTILLPGFVYPDEVKPIATVLGGFDGESVLVGGASSRVLVSHSEIEKGKSYSILHKGFNLKGARKAWYVYHYMGSAEVDEIIDGKTAALKLHGPSVARTGDLIVPLINVERKVDLSQGVRRRFNGKAKVISLVEQNTNVAGETGFLFLDKGYDDGLVLNQILDVRRNAEVQKLKGQDNKVIASVQIVDLTATGSTAYVVLSSQEVTVGDFATNR